MWPGVFVRRATSPPGPQLTPRVLRPEMDPHLLAPRPADAPRFDFWQKVELSSATGRAVNERKGNGAMGIRTPDLLNAIEALYQLSYDP